MLTIVISSPLRCLSLQYVFSYRSLGSAWGHVDHQSEQKSIFFSFKQRLLRAIVSPVPLYRRSCGLPLCRTYLYHCVAGVPLCRPDLYQCVAALPMCRRTTNVSPRPSPMCRRIDQYVAGPVPICRRICLPNYITFFIQTEAVEVLPLRLNKINFIYTYIY